MSACAEAGTPGSGHDPAHSSSHDVEAAAGTVAPSSPAPHGHDTATGTDDDAEGGGHVHDHGAAEDAVVTTGPPRPADPDLACGLTVLEDIEQVIRYCGHGHMNVTLGDAEEVYVDGAQCEDRGGFFLMHFGTSYSDEATARGEYVGLVLEDMPAEGEGTPRVSALEFTAGGHRQAVAEAEATVTWIGDEVELELAGDLASGEAFAVHGHCAVDEG